MKIETVDLDIEDVKIIKKAMYSNSVFFAKILVSIVFFFVFSNIDYTDDIFLRIIWLKTVLNLIPYFVFASAIFDFSNFILDIKNKKKIILTSLCKAELSYSDVVSRSLNIQDYGEIIMTDYNYRNYFTLFSDQFELFEVHIAPKSKTLLYAKKLIK
jgi:hypothetical protein